MTYRDLTPGSRLGRSTTTRPSTGASTQASRARPGRYRAARLHPHAPAAWAKAPDRFDTTSCYRELGRAVAGIIAGLPADQRPLALGVAATRRYFDVVPTTAIFPGDAFRGAPVERALDFRELAIVVGRSLSLE